MLLMQIRKLTENCCLLLAALVSLTLAGCGGGETISEPLRNSGQNDSSSGMRAPQLKPSKPQKPEKKVAKTEAVDLPGDPDDHFEVVEYIHNYAIRQPGDSEQKSDEFAVVLPQQPEANSSTFQVVNNPQVSETQTAPAAAFKLPTGFTVIESAGYSAQGLPRRILCERDSSEMVLVPAGVSVQGVSDPDSKAGPEFTVYQDAFYMDVKEVTLEQYRRWRSEMIAAKGKIPEPAGNDSQPDQYPALGISYTDALNYARTMGKQLPHETQWEKAARGETGFQYPWGNGRELWHQTRQPGQIDPVGVYPGDQSPYGVLDLAGNAREWCDDWYSENAYRAALALSNAGVVRGWTGPKRPVVPNMRVVRGGKDSWEVWQRAGENMRTPPADVGFRGVLNLSTIPSGANESPKPAGSF